MMKEDFNPNLHSYAMTTAKVEGGILTTALNTRDETIRGGHKVVPSACVVGMTPYKVKPLYNAEAVKVDEVESVNKFLRAAGVKRRFVCYALGGKWSASAIVNAAEEIGHDVSDVVWAMEGSSAKDVPNRAADGATLVVTLYDVYDDTGVLKIKAHGLYYRDYRPDTWRVIVQEQEHIQMDNVVGHFEGDAARTVYAKPDAEQLSRLYGIEVKYAPIYTPNNEKDIERDIKAYAAAFAMCDKAQVGPSNDNNV